MAQQRQSSRINFWICLVIVSIISITFAYGCGKAPTTSTPAYTPSTEQQENVMKLPEPRYDSDVSLEESLLQRRSIRSYTGQPLALQEVSQLLWASQGITDPTGFRAAPSAGALYPLEIYVVVGDVQGLSSGVYHYEPEDHQLVKLMDGDKRAELASAALGQSSVKEGAVDFVFTGVYERTTTKYGDRGIKYVHMEVGHAAQNLCLQATAMGLGAVTIGAFYDEQITGLLNLPEKEKPLYIIPVGKL
jgi:SagB-type dehydrogenase family enzyme